MNTQTHRVQTDCGHGHVYTREDGAKARCGGPAMCRECARDYINALPGNWLTDSSLETWFPLTAEEFERTKTERDRLRQALKDLAHAYVNLLESGRDRIVSLGGDCDSVEVMERGDPYLKKAREALAS